MNKLKVACINDLHLDHWVPYNPSCEKYEKLVRKFVKGLVLTTEGVPSESLLIIAGDLSHYNRVSAWVIDELAKHFEHVVFVTGNHDYYLVSGEQRKKYKKDSWVRKEELYEMTIDIPNVTMLGVYRNWFTYKGFKIGGATMTSLPTSEEGISFYNGFMNDKRYILNPVGDLHGQDMIRYNELSKVGLDIFISHYPLITTYTHRKYINDGSIESYKCIVGGMIAPYNFFGHVHESEQMYEAVGTKHYTNALGYPHEHLDSKIKMLELDKI